MPWYYWVWGGVSTLGGLTLAALCVVAGWDIIERRKQGAEAVEETIRKLRVKCERLETQLALAKRDNNEWGKISP